MNLLFIIDHLRPDGAQLVLTQIAEGLAIRGHHLGVLCLNDRSDSALIERLRLSDIEVHVIDQRALISGIGLLSAGLWAASRRFDLAVTFLFFSDVLGRPLARLAGIPHIITSIQARNIHYSSLQRWLVRRTIRLADLVVLSSAGLKKFVLSEEGAPLERTRVIYNGISLPNVKPVSRAEFCAEFHLPSQHKLIGSVGRLNYQKGFDILLKALARMPLNDILLFIIGSGEEEGRLRQAAKRLGVDTRVCFAGQRRDVSRLLGALDLYVHASRFEGMPLAVIEAMAAGLPVVATATDGTSELICDERYGWLVPIEQDKALADAMVYALQHEAEARKRAKAGQDRARELFSAAVMVDKWEQILVEVYRNPSEFVKS